jgi:hypothetical protein
MGGHFMERVPGNAVSFGEEHSELHNLSVSVDYLTLLHRYSLLPAITVDGIIYSHIKVGGYNSDEFLEYLDGLTAQMNPYPQPHSILIIDNCQTHHVDGVEELCESWCVTTLNALSGVVMDIPQWNKVDLFAALLA